MTMTFAVHQLHREPEDKPSVINLVIGMLEKSWCWKMFYIVDNGDNDKITYMRNDGKLFEIMQESSIDLNGGTYFLTQQDAQDCLDRYNAAQFQENQDTQT